MCILHICCAEQVTVTPTDEPRFLHTGAMTKPFCHDMPLYGDSILLAIFAVFCSVVALWFLLSGERRLRRRLSEAVRRTEATVTHKAERATKAGTNPLISQGQAGEWPGDESSPALSAKDSQLKFVQTRYDYMAMLGEQQRSFCQWIVNKTWWDVTCLLQASYYLTLYMATHTRARAEMQSDSSASLYVRDAFVGAGTIS